MQVEQVDFRVAGLDCENEASAIQRGFRGISGISNLKIYVKSAKVGITFDPALTSPDALKDKLQEIGFPVQEGGEPAGVPKPWRNPKVITSLSSGVLLLAGYILSTANELPTVSVACYVAAILIGGYYFSKEAIEKLIRHRIPYEHRCCRSHAFGRNGRGGDAGIPLFDIRGRRGLYGRKNSFGYPSSHGSHTKAGLGSA
jgi:cation transport ATPase